MTNVSDHAGTIREQVLHQIGVRLAILRDDHTVNGRKVTETRKDVVFTTAKGDMTLIMYAEMKPYRHSYALSFPKFGVSILSPRDGFVAEGFQSVINDDEESIQRHANEIADTIVEQLEHYLQLPEPVTRWNQFWNWVFSWGNHDGKHQVFASA